MVRDVGAGAGCDEQQRTGGTAAAAVGCAGESGEIIRQRQRHHGLATTGVVCPGEAEVHSPIQQQAHGIAAKILVDVGHAACRVDARRE